MNKKDKQCFDLTLAETKRAFNIGFDTVSTVGKESLKLIDDNIFRIVEYKLEEIKKKEG